MKIFDPLRVLLASVIQSDYRFFGSLSSFVGSFESIYTLEYMKSKQGINLRCVVEITHMSTKKEIAGSNLASTYFFLNGKIFCMSKKPLSCRISVCLLVFFIGLVATARRLPRI